MRTLLTLHHLFTERYASSRRRLSGSSLYNCPITAQARHSMDTCCLWDSSHPSVPVGGPLKASGPEELLTTRRRHPEPWRRKKPPLLTMFNSTASPTANAYANATTTPPAGGPPPWYQYHMCSVAPYGYVFYFLVKVLNLSVGAPCNILVIWQIASKKSDASTSDTFIFNLAVLDAFFCLMTPIDMVNRLLLGDGDVWFFQRFTYGVKDVAPLFLVCICLDRYIAVVHPVLFTSIRDNKLRIGISVVVWGFTLAYGVAKSLLDVVKASGIFSGVILFAFAVMVFCNISILWVLRRSVAGKEVMHPVKKRAFKTLLIILVIIVVNYLPPVALMPFVAYYSLVAYRCQISTSVFALMDLSSSLEPLLYITKMELNDVKCCGRSLSEKPEDVKV